MKQWPLESGTWSPDLLETGFVLDQTAQGHPVSAVLSREDLSSLLQTGCSADAPEALYPPEFKFSPASGAALQRPNELQVATWVPPFGAATMSPRASRAIRGLRQSSVPLSLSRQHQRQADADPDATLALPPPGDYEFFSIAASTRAATLLALDPAKGLIYAFLPASKRWEILEHDGGGLLSESRIDRAAWRCEVFSERLNSLVFLPGEEGLTCLCPDVPGLSFSAHTIGGAPAVGSPLQFGELVWAPLRTQEGSIRFVSSSSSGEAAEVVDLPLSGLSNLTIGQVHAPFADGRTAVWPCDAGQLLLRKQATGAVDASFLPWPVDVLPAFEFGSPYLSRDGTLWQLCFDTQQDSYVYLQLGAERFERVRAQTPRMCSGLFNFRFATKFKSEPWVEPEHGDDGATDEIVLPLLESAASASALGLKLETTAGLADVLRSTERLRAVLVLDDASNQTEFHTIAVAEPWRLRHFVHGGLLWAYHPLLSRIDGWTLNA